MDSDIKKASGPGMLPFSDSGGYCVQFVQKISIYTEQFTGYLLKKYN